jgi:hypothetical protein
LTGGFERLQLYMKKENKGLFTVTLPEKGTSKNIEY